MPIMIASNCSWSSSIVMVRPTSVLQTISHPEVAQVVDLEVDDLLGQAELGDAVDEHPAGAVQRLEDRAAVAQRGPVRRRRPGPPGRSR